MTTFHAAVHPDEVLALQRAVAELSLRVSHLEAGFAEARNEPPPISDEIVLAISAAVAAYLGKRAKVRHVRLASGSTWVQPGRAHVHMARDWSSRSR